MLENVHTSFSSWAIAFEAHSTSSWKEAFTISKATQNLMLQNCISVFSVFADFLENITAEYSIYYVIWQKKKKKKKNRQFLSLIYITKNKTNT